MVKYSEKLDFNPYILKPPKQTAQKRIKFLQSFGHGKNQIFCYNGDPTQKISSMNHTGDLDEVLLENQSGSDAYFYINNGRKQCDISQHVALYVDLDAGRDASNKYLRPSVVIQKKKQMLQKLEEFGCAPTWIVDTRNGYQLYWVLTAPICGAKKFKALQNKLVNYFQRVGSDIRASKSNQIYRVPYTVWYKKWEGKKPYMTSILPCSSGKKIKIDTIINKLNNTTCVVKNISNNRSSEEWFRYHAERNKTQKRNVRNPQTISISFSNDLNQALIADEELISNTADFLDQVSNTLYFTKNKFLATSAKKLSSELRNKYLIGN